MGFRLSFGVGPLRYSKSLSGKRRRRKPAPRKPVVRQPRVSAKERQRQEADHAARVEHVRQERLDREKRTFNATAENVTHDDGGNLVFQLVPWDKTRPTINVTLEEAAARRMRLVSLRNHTNMIAIVGKDGASFEFLERA